ncbi:MAG: MGMT family protein [Actinomycetota bacterium]|nr:MGMT family protein [Actinomycetota bacterium]
MASSQPLDERIIDVIRLLEPGEVVSYGYIASDAGAPRASRHVGRVLAQTAGLCWWRVVNSQGRLVPGNEREHARLLRDEGVKVFNGCVTFSPKGRFSLR